MNKLVQESILKEYRKKTINGKCIDLVPITEKLLPDVVRLRNQEKSRYYLNQKDILTLNMQRIWYDKYINRLNDIYWCILNKDSVVIGTVRLYNINEKSCIHGSLIIDEEYSMGMPYALEAELLTIEFAFEKLNVIRIINDDREDNIAMNSISRKLGFKLLDIIIKDGVEYKHYSLERGYSKTQRYRRLLEEFMDR